MSQKLLSSLMRPPTSKLGITLPKEFINFENESYISEISIWPNQTNIYCPDKGGFTFSNMFDIQICKYKINFGANYQSNGDLILNLYKNVARSMEVSGTWRSGCWRFDCIIIIFYYFFLRRRCPGQSFIVEGLRFGRKVGSDSLICTWGYDF